MRNSHQLLYLSFTIEGSSNVEIVGVHVGVARETQFLLDICWQQGYSARKNDTNSHAV